MLFSLKKLLKIYSSFEPTKEFGLFRISKEDEFYLGKENKMPVFVLSESKQNGKERRLTTKSIDLLLNRKIDLVELKGSKEKSKKRQGHIIKTNEVSEKEKELFISLVWNLLTADKENLEERLEGLLKDFRSLTESKSQEQEENEEMIGLYGELLVIFHLSRTFVNYDIYSWWRSEKFAKFDFSISDNKKIEVKSTFDYKRKHRFSHYQLYIPTNENIKVIIASCLLNYDENGKSLYDFYIELKEKILNNFSALKKLDKEIYNLGIWRSNPGLKVNFPLAISNIRFFKVNNIPHWKRLEPQGVSNTKHSVILDDSNAMKVSEVYKWITDIV
ncbi:MAG: PD-(D/E)XK motif protein [Candidatus Moeniiplasma glomeromycotorum]|nr:PD-(D/E)XK motif protein [Candidatus Moeniiplasma glomeromycotorum]MCE8162383.1 PD-(D/E)XK motif protein [Candidatus Moeniiplasma glomeromycotorum]MCE8166308.1 PD-(D/E)XK motif protein [Candidatus Moeniiplasma glomeromycotorum]MCE8166790.1 PD-(D/E)XK motif protein [Candidatus Moeniiplasma glomeromycotorum]